MTIIALTACAFTIGCETRRLEAAAKLTGGNPRAGREKIVRYGCPTCHEIPGIASARGRVGPPLIHIATRVYLAGRLPNTPENMMRWVQKPQEIENQTAMPDMGITDDDARDITAYLYSLR